MRGKARASGKSAASAADGVVAVTERKRQRTVLLAVCGLSPAVITETVWAMATDTKNPCVPDRVVALTTVAGRAELVAQLLDSGVWERLRDVLKAPAGALDFGDAADSIRLFPAPGQKGDLADIATSADNIAAADFILKNLREFTEDPQTRLIVSLAGGRKTMSALAALCLTLVGREQDRLCHVLVNSPFDTARPKPQFYFPDPKVRQYIIDGTTTIPARSAVISLIDVPFVRLRPLFQEKFYRVPCRYMDWVRTADKSLDQLLPEAPPLKLSCRHGTASIGDSQLRLSPPEFAVLQLLAERCRQGRPAIDGVKELRAAMQQWYDALSATIRNHGWQARAWNHLNNQYNGELLRKVPSAINDKLKALSRTVPGALLCSPLTPEHRGRYELRLKPENIVIVS